MCSGIDEFRMPGTRYMVLYCKNTRNYITHNVTFDLQKTRGWSPTRLLKYTFENSGCGQKGDQTNQNKYCFTCSEFSYIYNLHIYQPVPMFAGCPGMFCMPSGKQVWERRPQIE